MTLRQGDVLAVVLPEDFLDDAEITRFVTDIGAERLSYEIIPGDPSEYARQIFVVVLEFLRQRGYVT